jgi:hypothetical protein
MQPVLGIFRGLKRRSVASVPSREWPSGVAMAAAAGAAPSTTMISCAKG